MHYLDIAEQIVAQRLKENPGATPSDTVASNLTEDLKRLGNSRFSRVGRGVYGLRAWEGLAPAAENLLQQDEEEANQPPSVLAVRAYGIFWDRSQVDWKKSVPRILGQQFENAAKVDFCEQRGIYVLFDHRTLVYVGRATHQSLGTRLRDHTTDRLRSRWDRFSWFGFKGVQPDGTLDDLPGATLDMEGVISVLEAVLIELTEPPQNRQQGKGLGGIEYLQHLDPGLRSQSKKQELLGLMAKAMESQED